MPTTLTKAPAEKLVRMHFDFFNDRKLDEGVKHVAKDFVATNVPMGETYRGPQGYQRFNQMWIDAFKDAHCHLTRVVAQDNVAAVEFRGTGKHTGTLDGPNGEIRPTNKKVDMPFIEVYEFKNDKLQNLRLYFDVATMMRQLGVEF